MHELNSVIICTLIVCASVVYGTMHAQDREHVNVTVAVIAASNNL